MPVITRADFSIAVYRVCKPLWVLEDFLFSALKLGVREWQFGHRISRFSGRLFFESPSMWLSSRGMIPVVGWVSPHPHWGHLWLHWSRRYCLMAREHPKKVSPVISPFSQAGMSNFLELALHTLLQYLPFFPTFSTPQWAQTKVGAGFLFLPLWE